MRLPFGEVITLRRRTLARDAQGVARRNGYGEVIYETTETDISGCSISPAGAMGQAFSFEAIGGYNSQVSIRYILHLPPGTEVDADDMVVWRGKEYELEGEPGLSRSPFSGRSGPVETYIKRVRG